jgi:hypothetical protein
MPACYYEQFDAGGAVWSFSSVGDAGEDRHIAAKDADRQECANATARPKEDTAGP